MFSLVNFATKTYFCIYILCCLHKDTHQKKITIASDIEKWNTLKCNKHFYLQNHEWRSSLCNNKAERSECSANLITDITLRNIQEVNVSILVNTSVETQPPIIRNNITGTTILGRIDSRSKKYSMQLYKDTFQIEGNRLQLAFTDYFGFCGSISGLSVSYYKCDKSPPSLAMYPSSKAPSRRRRLTNITGSCIKHAVSNSPVFKSCNWKGQVKEYGNCVCGAGYAKQRTCTLCFNGYYKNTTQNSVCKRCGDNSVSTKDRQNCLCKDRHFRELGKEKYSGSPCHDVKPKNLQFHSITSESVNITWERYNMLLNLGNFSYTINCKNCEKNEGNFPHNTTTSSMSSDMLKPGKLYFISVTVLHGSENTSLSIIGSFTTQALAPIKPEKKGNRTNATIILFVIIAVGLILLSSIIIVSLYIIQKRKSTVFLRRINSLKKSQRPPLPPTPQLHTIYVDVKKKSNTDINPYAVFVPKKPTPIPELNTDDENSDDGAMLCVKSPRQRKQNKQGNISDDEDRDGYVSMNANLKLFEKQTNTNHYSSPMSMQMARRQNINPSERKNRTQSCFFHEPTAYDITLKQIELAKLNSKYKRAGSKDFLGIDFSVPRRPHSADDINKIFP